MPPASSARQNPRKRTRKRKRRVASSSSSSSSSSDSESSDSSSSPQQPTKPTKLVQQVIPEPPASESSTESSDSDSESQLSAPPLAPIATTEPANNSKKSQPPRFTSPSPSPPPADIPPFIPSTDPETKKSQEELMKEKFRKFWLASVADGFKDDLEEIRKEQNLGPSRLSLLIDALASGADVFSSSSRSGGTDINEMEVVLEQTDVER